MGPKEGRYKFLSLNKSARGKKLLVGETVMRNQSKEKVTTGEMRRKFFIVVKIAASQITIGMKLKKFCEVQCVGKS